MCHRCQANSFGPYVPTRKNGLTIVTIEPAEPNSFTFGKAHSGFNDLARVGQFHHDRRFNFPAAAIWHRSLGGSLDSELFARISELKQLRQTNRLRR